MTWQNNLDSLAVRQVAFFSVFFLVSLIILVLMWPFYALRSLLRFCWAGLVSEFIYCFGSLRFSSQDTTTNDLLTIEGDQMVYRIESRNILEGSEWKFVKHDVGPLKVLLERWPDGKYVEFRIKRSTIWNEAVSH